MKKRILIMLIPLMGLLFYAAVSSAPDRIPAGSAASSAPGAGKISENRGPGGGAGPESFRDFYERYGPENSGNPEGPDVKYTDCLSGYHRDYSGYEDFFRDEIFRAAGPTDTPVIIKETWETVIDGAKITAVNAGNAFPADWDPPAGGAPGAGENPVIYRASAIFCENRAPALVKLDLYRIGQNWKEYGKAGKDAFFTTDDFDAGSLACHTAFYYTAQSDGNNNLLLCHTSCSGASDKKLDMRLKSSFSFGDCDGDGETEIIFYYDSNYGYRDPFTVFRVKDGAVTPDG